MNYSRFGAICVVYLISVSGAKAPLCGHTETAVWRHCLLPKKVALRTFRHHEKCFKCDIIHERPTNVCILPGFWTCGVFYNTLSVIKIKC